MMSDHAVKHVPKRSTRLISVGSINCPRLVVTLLSYSTDVVVYLLSV